MVVPTCSPFTMRVSVAETTRRAARILAGSAGGVRHGTRLNVFMFNGFKTG